MNKIFKVVWSKTKECYIVVSEVAKNNSGKKKVLASVLAALAVVGAGATQVDAASFGAGGGNAAADASISIGGGYSGPKTAANDKFAIAIGDNASATGKSSISMGYKAETNGQVSIAIGEESKVKKSEGTAVGPGAVVEERFGAAFGHEAKATKQYATAIGSGAQGEGEDSQAIGRQAQTTGYRAVAVGTLAKALNNSAVAIGEKSVADGTNSIAMGKMSKAHSFDAIAIGHNNNSRTYSAISIGTDNTSDVAYGLTDAQFDALPYDENNINDPNKTDPRRGVSSTIAIGRNNLAGNVEAIAIGTETKATKTDAIAIGARAEATGDYALAIGGAAGGYKVSAAEYGTAVGVRANAANRGAAFGAGSNAEAQKSVAIGYTAKASAQKATSNYEFSGSNGTLSPAGYNTETITINSKSAPTGGAAAGNYYDAGSAIAVGDGATVSDESDRAVVIGPNAKTNGNAHYSVVLGSGSHADASDGFVAGHGSYVESRESIAMGSAAHVSGNENIRSQAIGYGATVSGTGAYDATAIGATAQVSGVQGGVALGSGSLLSRTTASNENIGWNSKYLNGTVVRNRAYTATVNSLNDQWDAGAQIGAVSVGNDTQKRQIINVAAGNKDTDAVNVAQLKNVGVRVGADTNTATIGTNKVAADFLAYNGQLNIKGDNNRVTTVSENDSNGKDANVNVKFDYDGLVKAKDGSSVTVNQKTEGGKTVFEIDAAAGSKTVVADGKNTTVTGAGTTASPYKVNVEGALTGISSITNNGGGKIEFATGGTTISGGPVNVSNNKITGVANGDVNSTSTDAVNGSQLHAVKTAERHIAPTTTGHEYTVDSNGDVTMTYRDGNDNAVANEKAVIKGIAKQDLSNINDAGKKVITGLGTIVKAGDNVNVSESSDATTGQKTYTVNAVTPAVYTKADGTKVYKRPDGTFTTNSNLAAGNNVDKGDVITSFMDGNGNTTGGNMVINNVGSAIKNAGNAGDSFLTKLDAANTATPNAAVNVSDLKNTADGLTDKGLRFDANEGNEKTNKLGSKVTVQGTGALSAGKAYADEYNTANIRTNINQDSDGNTTINVGLAKALKGINSISNGNSSITLNSNPGGTNNTPAVSITGGNLSMGNNKIVNLAPGTADTDAVNVKQLKDTELHITPGTYTPGTDKKVKLTYTDGNGGVVSGKEAVIDLSGLSTGGTSSTEKVKKAANGANDTNIAEVNPQTGDTYGAADATYEVSVSRNAVKDAAREAVTVNNGGTTTSGTYTADANNPISVTATPDNTNHNTTYAVTFDGNKAAKQIPLTYKATNGTTTSAEQTVKLDKGLNFTGGDYTTASVGADGKVTFDVNLGTTPTVTDGKPGVPGQAGATGKDGIATVKTVVDTINNSGWKANAKANGGKLDGTATATVVKPGNTVNYAAGKNLIVNQELEKDASNALTGNQTYTYSLNKDIDLTNAGSLTVGDTTVNNGGITIKAPTPAAGATATTDVKLTNTGLDNGGNKIVNVKDGDVSATSTDAVNGSQLHAVKAAERHIKPDTYAVDGNGKVTMKYVDGDNQDVTGEAVITGIAKQDLSNISDAGKKVITGLGSIVEAGDNVTVTSTENTTTGQKTYTVNAVTPAVYTTPDGEKLTKKSDGKFYKADGSEYTGGDIITSFENPNANSIPAGKNSTTDGGMIVNNIGSAIKTQNPTMPAGQTATYLDKLKAAADAGSNVKNAAVNVSDLHNTAEALKSNELHIRPTTTNRTDETVNKNNAGTAESYKYDAATQSVTLKYNDGTGAGVTGTEAKIDLSDLANQITSGYTFKTNATENGGKVVNDAATPAAETAVANGGVVNYAAGKNLTVKQDIEKDGTGAATGKQTYTYALSDEIGIGEKGQPGVAGKDGVDGKIGVNGKDGSSVVINGKDGSIGMTGPQGKDGKDGINGRDGANISMTSAKGEQVLINRDPAHSADTDKAERIVYVPKDASGNPIQDANGKNIVREVATMDDGLKFTGNNESTVNNNKLNTLVKVQGEGTKEGTNAAGAKEVQTSDGTKFESAKDNIAVVADGTNTLTVKLNKKLKGLDSVQTKTVELGDHTTPGGTTNITYNTGDNRIEYTTPGTTDTKKVATTDDIWTIQGNGTDVAPVNGKVNVKAGENILITTPATADGSMTINAVTPAVYTDKDGNKLTKDKDGKFHKDDGTEVAAADVITSIQDAAGNTTGGHSIVNNVGSAINNHATPGVTSPTYLDKLDAAAGDTKTQNAAVNVTDLKNTADGLTDKGLNFTGNNESTVNKHKLGSLVKVQGEGTKDGTNAAGTKEIQTSDGTKFESAKDNIAVEANNGDTLTVKLNKNLKGLDSVQTKTVELGDHTTPGGTTNITYNTGDNRIEYTTPGTTDTKKVATTDDIWTIQGNGTDVAPVNGKVNVKAGENILITTPATADGSMTINAVTPAIYTDKNGNKVVKRPDGTYTTNLDGSTGNDVAANDVIVSFKDAAGNTTGGNSIINNVGSAIKNQTPTMPAGQTATYLDKLKAAADDTKTQNAAVNVSDLHNTANALRDNELHIAPTAVKSGSTEAKGGAASGNTNPGAAAQAYKYNATTKQVELTFNDGNGNAVANTKAVIDLSELAGSIQNYGFQTNADGNLKDGTTATATAVASGKTVTYAAGKNLTVEQEIAANGNQTYTYALNKDLTNLDKVVVNGKDGIDGKDGVSITGPKGESAPGAKDGQDGKVGIAGKDGKDAVSISGKDGVGHIGLQGPKGTPGTPGADGASLDISTDHGTQTLVKPEANNDNKSERIVYVPKDKDGNPLKDTDGNVIKREVATMDDGLKFAGDDGTVIKKALGTQLDIVGGATGALSDNNIGVNNDNGKLKVQLAKKIDLTDAGSVTTGNTKVNNDGITITNPTDSNKNVSLTGTGLNNGGNKITNVKAGENPTDAVNVQQLKDNVTTVKSSDNTISVKDTNLDKAGNVIDKTKGHQYDITINNQSVVEHAQTPVVYTDKDGNKLYKIVDPTTNTVTFNTKEDGTGTTVQPGDVIASMNNGGDSTTTPMKLNNVASSIQKPNSTDTFLKQLDDANKNTPNGAVNVSDLKKTSDALIDKGLVFDANNADPKTNKLGSKVTIAGTGALANGENFADKYDTSNIRTNITQNPTTGNTTVEIGLNKNLKGLESVSVPGKDGVDGRDGVSITGKDGANGIDGKVGIGKDGKDAVSISGKDGIGHIGLTGPAGKDGKNATADITVKEGKAGVDGKDGITRIVYNDKDGNEHQVATHDDGLRFTGNNTSKENKQEMNSLVKVQGEGVTENAAGKLEVNGQEFKSAAGNIAVVADGDNTLTVKMNKDLNLTKDGSVTMGDTVVNNDGITIKAPTTSGTTDVKLTNQGLDNGGNKITNVAAGTANTDAVNVKQLKDKVTTVKSSDGSITVTDANAGSTDPTKGHAYDIKVNNQGVVNNAQIPVVYTKDDGTKVYKQPDGTFNTAKDGSGDVVAANKVIASMNNAANSSTDPTKLQNVGSSIADKAGNTYLDKINAAAGDNHAKTGAVNVSDLKNTADAIGEKGLNFGTQSTGANSEIHKNLGEKLEIVGGGTKADDEYDASNIKTMTKDGKVVIALDKNIKADSVTVGEKGQPGVPGKNGMDGKIGVNGKDGSAVVINGKDGSIGLNGKDGANGITIKGDKGVDGVDGVNGTNGITRIVYQDKDGNNHEVATHDDGMKFAGDDGQTNQDTNPKVIKKHLNKVVDIVGGADKTKLTDNNIGVNNDGGKLRVQLANELSGINKISNGNSSISIADVPAGATTPAVTISGGNLSMGDNKITNVKAGTNDTDAVNYKQLKDSRTTVTSQDGSVTITPTQNGDSTNYDLKVNPPLDPRVDQLAEEIGRVGAQGAALSALKPIQYDPLEPTQIMAGYGNYRGNSAIAMGVAHYKNESTLIHGGISWAGGSSHMMANAGVTWKVGNRDSEAAVADRYRKGPISSAYAMQQEMAAMKAQNAGLKGEVSDLKAENEQMKAQIAAMMAKLGL